MKKEDSILAKDKERSKQEKEKEKDKSKSKRVKSRQNKKKNRQTLTPDEMSVRSSAKKKRREAKTAYMFLLPWLIGFVAFTGFPLLYTFVLSFFDVRLNIQGWQMEASGITNYVTALLRNTEYVPALMEYITIVLSYVPAIIVVSLILALLLNMNLKGRAAFRMIYFLPVIVLSGSAMFQLTDTGNTMIGDINDYVVIEFLQSFSPGIGNTIEGLLINFTMVLWFTGVPIVLLINGLQKIDREQYEAASIDGATAWQTLWKITMPQMRDIILISTIFSIVQVSSFNINPMNDIISSSIYNTATGLGLASSYASVYTFVMLLIIGVAFLLLFRREKQPEYTKTLDRAKGV